MTDYLQEQRYWPSFNIPYFKTVYNKSGFPSQTPHWAFSHQDCPRAQIFAERHASVVDIASYQSLIRYNDWKHDPLSRGDSCNAISARCDLNALDSPDYALSGGLDAKVTSAVQHASRFSFFAQMGPTTYNEQPVFDWASARLPHGKLPTHEGQPEKFDFSWVEFS